MFVELADRLRCVRPHEDTWLVLAARRTVGRHVVDGVLGCPSCRAEYPVRDGVADFRADAAREADDPAPRSAPLAAADPDELLRLAALLAVVDVRAPVVLAGAWQSLAGALGESVPGLYLVRCARCDRAAASSRRSRSRSRTACASSRATSGTGWRNAKGHRPAGR